MKWVIALFALSGLFILVTILSPRRIDAEAKAKVAFDAKQARNARTTIMQYEFCAASGSTYWMISQAQARYDEAAVEALILKGRAVKLAPGTQIENLFSDDHLGLFLVRVLSGSQIDERCYVSSKVFESVK